VRLTATTVLAVVLASGATAVWADGDRVEVSEVKVVGGTTISAETVEYYLGVAEGDPYDRDAIAGNFRRFWDSGLVEDLKVESEEVGPGKVRLIVTVRERPKVVEFDFKGNKKISSTTLREKLDTAGVSLKRNVPLRTSEVQQIRQALVEAYGKEGYASATVEPAIEEFGPNLRKVVFVIDEGVKIKIGEIRIDGNEVFGDRRLRHALKKAKQRSLLHPFGKKLIWSKEAWGEDSENLKKFYMDRGYKDVVVGEPKVDLIARNPEGGSQKEKKFHMVVSIPVQEGKPFKLGSVRLAGVTVIPEERLRKLYEVKLDKTYNYAAIEAGNEAVRNAYQARGYIYSYTNQSLAERSDQPDTVDVVVNVYEGDRYRLGRLEFTGNSKTQDKVLRREFRLIEGAWMNMATFKRSVFKVNQLGYFKLTEDPLEFKFDDENKLVNVVVKGQEVGRTDIQFGAGYSELDHFFFQFSFNTRNFLGRGETLGAAVSTGGQRDSLSLSFSEPYFLDRAMVIGGSLYKQKLDLPDYIRDSQGGSVVWGMNLADFGNFSLLYSYEDVYAKYNVTRMVPAGEEPRSPHRRPIDPPYSGRPFPELFFDTYEGVTSSFTPAVQWDSRDDPFDPNEGLSAFARVRYAGGVLGGDFNYVRPEVGGTIFLPLSRKNIFAANFEGGIIMPFDSSLIPVYDRYRLGGERSLRGFSYYQVLPRKRNGDYFLTSGGAREGGDRYLQFNVEYQIKVGGPVKFILFLDVANTWHEDQGWDLGWWRYGTGAEMRIFLPVFQAPLRFIYGINLDPFPDEKARDFQFSIGTTF